MRAELSGLETSLFKAAKANFTTATAGVAVVVALVLVATGHLEPSRAFTAMVFASCLAAHSADQERRYRREIMTGVQAVAAAGAKLRAGDRAGAEGVVREACGEIGTELQEDRAQAGGA